MFPDDNDDDFMGFEEKRRKRGRPKGSQNRSQASIVTEERIDAAYKRLKPLLTKEQAAYLDEMRSGKRAFDPMMSLEIMLRQVEVIFADVSENVWTTKNATREFGELINAFRMGIKDYEDIRRARKKDEDTTQGVASDRLAERDKYQKQLDELFGPVPAKE